MRPSLPFQSLMWLLFEKISVLLLSFFVTITIARYLLPESFGKLSFWMAIISLVTPAMALGLNSLISRELLRREKDRDVIIGTAFTLRCIAGLCVASIGALLTHYFLPPSDALLLALLLFASIANATLVIDFWLQAVLANRHAAIFRLVVLLVFGVLRLIAVGLLADLSIFVYIIVAEVLVLGIGYLALYQYLTGGLRRLKVSFSESRGLLADSRWLFVSGLAAVLYLKIDQVMLGILIDQRAVGIYAVAAKFSEVWYFFPSALVTAYFPYLIDQRKGDKKVYALGLQKLNDLLFVVALVIALLVTASADRLVPLLFGNAYSASVPVLLVHIWAALLVFMRALLSKWLIAENLLRLSLLSQIMGALANIALNACLIPLYGPLGAAYATVLSYLVAGYLILFVHKDLRPMAQVVNRSLLLPVRLLRYGRKLYESDCV